MKKLRKKLIAPCGMNCNLCIAHLREKNTCPGCNEPDTDKAKYCITCRIKNCDTITRSKIKFCYVCDKFPCTRMKQLDKRYRTKYGMSMIANLNFIKTNGILKFMKKENEKWLCKSCGEFISVHKPECITCGTKWKKDVL